MLVTANTASLRQCRTATCTPTVKPALCFHTCAAACSVGLRPADDRFPPGPNPARRDHSGRHPQHIEKKPQLSKPGKLARLPCRTAGKEVGGQRMASTPGFQRSEETQAAEAQIHSSRDASCSHGSSPRGLLVRRRPSACKGFH
jgi:hypothetical protein